MEKRAITIAACTLMLGIASASAQASDSPHWSVQIGPAHIAFHERANFTMAGSPVPGAGVKVQKNTTLAAEISYWFSPSLSAGLTLGIPARARVVGAGDAQAFGELGAVRYGPLGLTARYTFNAGGRWHPYIGAGITYYAVFKEYDAFVKDVKVDNAFGSIVQLGLQYDIDSRLGLFIDAKKLFVKATVMGNVPAMGGAPAKADVRLDPLGIHAGLSYRF